MRTHAPHRSTTTFWYLYFRVIALQFQRYAFCSVSLHRVSTKYKGLRGIFILTTKVLCTCHIRPGPAQLKGCSRERLSLACSADVVSRFVLLLRCAEERCREELRREDIVVEISVVSFFPELFGWYEAQGYRRTKAIPFPVPELIRDGCSFELQLMTKKIP